MSQNDDLISRQAAIDALDVLCQEHRYRIPGKSETYSQYNEAWQDALCRAENAIGNLPSAQPEQKTALWIIRKWGDDAKCSNCGRTFKDVYDMDNHDRFCRFCGSKMIGIEMIK